MAAGLDLDELIHRADLDGLIRLIDSCCTSRDWAALFDIRQRSRAAMTTGRQLWPAATLAEYRLALWADAPWACKVLDDDSGRFSIGPLSEVASQRHSFAELAAHLPSDHRLGLIAHERSLRGDEIVSTTPNTLELPFLVQPWEPQYQIAEYSDDGVDAPSPELPDLSEFRLVDLGTIGASGCEIVDDPDVHSAVRQLLDGWTAASTGKAEVLCVEGSAAQAVDALGASHVSIAPLSLAAALAWLGWAGASGGAQGRRRGAALGRFGAWSVATALADIEADWVNDADHIGAVLAGLNWFWWSAGEPSLGWELQLAVEDVQSGYAWVISAHDAA